MNDTTEPQFYLFQRVRILEGPFSQYIGEIVDINWYDKKAHLLIDFFMRKITIELPLNKIEAIS